MPQDFKLISVNAGDDEELVIHAGGGRAQAPAAAPIDDAPVPGGTGVSPLAQDAVEETGRGGKTDVRHERLRQRAEELDRAEENLRRQKLPRLQVRVLVALLALVALVAAYTLLGR